VTVLLLLSTLIKSKYNHNFEEAERKQNIFQKLPKISDFIP